MWFEIMQFLEKLTMRYVHVYYFKSYKSSSISLGTSISWKSSAHEMYMFRTNEELDDGEYFVVNSFRIPLWIRIFKDPLEYVS